MKQFTNKQLLSRVKLKKPLLEILKNVVKAYALGEYKTHSLVRVGYGDLNIILKTTKNTYFVKMFHSDKSVTCIRSYIKVIKACHQKKIPTPHLYTFGRGQVLYTKPLLCVFEFLKGKSLEHQKPTKKDLVFVTRTLAKLHTLKFKIEKNYDSWGTQHFLEEYRRKIHCVSEKYQKLTALTVKQFREIDFSKFRQCLIHGDIHDEHVIKDKNGNYRIIDFETADNGYGMVDFSIYCAMLAVDLTKSIEFNQQRIAELMALYSGSIHVSKYEQKCVPLLIRTTYLMYLLSASYEQKVNKDTTEKAKHWVKIAKLGLTHQSLQAL